MQTEFALVCSKHCRVFKGSGRKFGRFPFFFCNDSRTLPWNEVWHNIYILVIHYISLIIHVVIQMTVAELRIKEWGNSLGVIIPKELVKQHALVKGGTLRVDILQKKPIDGFGMFRGLPKFVRDHDDREEFWQ